MSERHCPTGGFYRLGYNIGKKPRMTIGFTFLLTLLFALGMGFPGLKNESRGDKLWVPTDTQAQAGGVNLRLLLR